jgi:hypothetical protein
MLPEGTPFALRLEGAEPFWDLHIHKNKSLSASVEFLERFAGPIA